MAVPFAARTAGPPPYLTYQQSLGKKVGTTITDAANPAAGSRSSLDTSIRCALMLRITKGSPNFTIDTCGVNDATGIVDLSYAGLIAGISDNTWSNTDITFESYIAGGAGYINNDGNTLAVDEGANGSLDSICVAWTGQNNDLEVSELVYRIDS